MRNFFCLIFLFLYIFKFVHAKKIIIPFKTSHNTEINFIESLLYDQIYATLEIGTMKQKVYLGLTTDESLFAIESAKINENNYNCNKSISYKNNRGIYIDIDKSQKYIYGDILNETFYFYNNLDPKKDDIKQYNDIMFGYITKLGRGYTYKDNGYIDNNKNLISGKIGLQITIDYSNTCHTSILKSLKNLNLIDNLVWSINYTNNEEGNLILGENPFQYNDNYTEEKRKKTACTTDSDRDFSWTLIFNDIKMGNQKLNLFRMADYSPQYGLIKGTSQYFELVKPYFENLEKCELKEIIFRTIKYNYYVCDININLNSFEPIIFIHTELEKKFILDKDDLFMDYNGKKYFLVLFQKESSSQKWSLGKPFVKKYQLVFDHESRNIFFYEYSPKSERTSTSKIVLICVCVVLGIGAIVLGIILGKVFLAEKKKKKAKELIDEINNNNGNFDFENNKENENEENNFDNNNNINDKLVI